MNNYKYLKTHDTLNPLLWDGFKLKEDVESKLKKIAEVFLNMLNDDDVFINVIDIVLVGSNTSYNYNDDSDIDLHFVVNLTVEESYEELLKDRICQLTCSLFKEKYSPKINGVDVEVYVENLNNTPNMSEAKYSLNNGWIKKPKKEEDLKIDQSLVNEAIIKYNVLLEDIKNLNDNLAFKTPEEKLTYINNLIEKIYTYRKELPKEGEFGSGNLAFKELRANGYLNLLKGLKTETENQIMSLNRK